MRVRDFPRFYSLPPVEYPYLLLNPNNYRQLYKRKFEHAILDSGVVSAFESDPGAADYPGGFLEEWKRLAVRLTKEFGDRLWVTIPDYPDDYHPGQGDPEKTLRNVEDFITIDGVNWLPVVQARYLDYFSLYESIVGMRELIGDYPRVAIGTVCKTNRIGYIEQACKAVRRHFSKSWVHAFGLTLTALPRVAEVIDSWDSMAWTKPRKPWGRGRGSAKNKAERVKYWHDYMEAIRRRLEVSPR